MVFINCTNSIALLLFLSCFCPVFCTATDTITPTQFIKDPETIISNGNTFKLGFFSPAGGSRNRYVGIWYADISVTTVIWVANRDKPLKDSSGIVTISDGNLLVLNGKREVLWSSNVSDILTNSSHAQILDSGNLVLKENNSNGRIIWESFEHLSDSFLPKMKLSTDVRTDEKIYLTSWKSPSNPSTGSFSAGMDGLGIPQFFIWNGSRPYWRTGPWNGLKFIGVPTMSSSYLEGFSVLYDKEGTVSITFGLGNGSILLKLFLNSEGALVQTGWDYGKEDWRVEWLAPETDCQVYGNCGAFGTCSDNSSICRCLRGFEPKYIEEWSRGNWTNGCVRRTPLQCERKNNTGGEVGEEDGFLKLKMIKVPDSAEWLSALEDDCKNLCLNNCSCVAYAYDTGIGCMKWSGNLIDIQEFSRGGMDLYIRAAYSELDKKRDMKVVITITVIIGTFTIAICTCFSWRWMAKQRGRKEKMKEMLLSDIGEPDNINQVKLQELPLFNFEKLAIATNNFNASNKLGQGGFGPVYRGKLLDGHEIAVKRLSRASGQGLEEFMNEVVVISKLQHRNLVRLLGCCVEGEEKMLIYEFMPNKSLDTFLFDPLKQELLDWRKRFNIIEGIGRGLLYLHRDSRLRIIHRDLKASNILLDEALNPKISDFGTARIFGGNQDQANTIRVVGTYGYMSPEYAMEGRFSEKSDVFSFGVLILEIVSGRRNTSFDHDEQSLSLLGFAWKLWNEYNIIALIDPGVSGPHFLEEILRCIHVGLLCVQEFAKDRPTVSTIISMLNSEIADLPIPKQPAFTERRNFRDTNSSEQGQKGCSMNNVTVTIIEGR